MAETHPSSSPPATREEAWRRLDAFLPRVREYAARRNQVEPPEHANVSGLSPWIQKRLLLEEEAIAAALRREDAAGAEKFVQELCWRAYWKGWLEHHPGAWERWRETARKLGDELGGERRSEHEAARAGRTDIACFNAWARELRETGWLHNHARMWFASIWIFTLRLPWELGAAFFHEHLLDGDAASNTLSWRWVAGLHTRGKTYLARADNIARYAPHVEAPPPGRLAEEAFTISEPPLARAAFAPRPAAWREAATEKDAARAGLWLHAEDLCPELGGLADARPAAIFAAWPRDLAVRAGWAAPVEAWTRAALADGVARATARYDCDAETADTCDPAASAAAWARERELRCVFAHEPAQGVWRKPARQIETGLAAAGVRLVWLRRGWDARLWPHATRGFFPFWEAAKHELHPA